MQVRMDPSSSMRRLDLASPVQSCSLSVGTANLRTKILDFGGFDSSRILMLRGGMFMSIGKLLQVLSRRILAGIILVGRLGRISPEAGNI